jgi:transposase
MGRKSKHLSNFTTEQVEAIFESDSKYRTGVKLFAIIQLGKGYSSRKLSEFYGTSFKQICNWADRFDTEGIKGLRMKPGRGRHSFLTEQQKDRLRDDFSKSPDEYGYNTSVWTGSIMREHIRRSCHVEYKQAAVYNLARKLGFNFQGKNV